MQRLYQIVQVMQPLSKDSKLDWCWYHDDRYSAGIEKAPGQIDARTYTILTKNRHDDYTTATNGAGTDDDDENTQIFDTITLEVSEIGRYVTA